MSISTSGASTMRKPIATMALARIGQRNLSAACAAPRLATITASRALICSAAQEASSREDNRRASNGDQIYRIAGLAMK